MHHIPMLALTAFALPLFVLHRVGYAGGSPGELCAAAKLKGTGKAAAASVACHATAARKGLGVDPACLAKADTKLIDTFAIAEARGGCVTTGDADDVNALIDSKVGDFVAALRPVTDANRCASRKLKATGKKAKTKLDCHAKATAAGLTVDPACLKKAEERFEAAFVKAEARLPCLTAGDAASVETLVDDLVSDAVAALPSPTTTSSTTSTTTTLPPGCGNGVREGSEQCDGEDADPLCLKGGRTGCFPAGGAKECRCCTEPGGQGFIDLSSEYFNGCCDGASAFPVAPGVYGCPEPTPPLCNANTAFPTCDGACPTGTVCVPLQMSGTGSFGCGCAPPGPCDGTCNGSECPVGEACHVVTCSCVMY